jgi:hypothetical protein
MLTSPEAPMNKLNPPFVNLLSTLAGTLLAFSLAFSVSPDANYFEVALPSVQATAHNVEISDLVTACNSTGSCNTRYYLQSDTDANSLSTVLPVGARNAEITPRADIASSGEAADEDKNVIGSKSEPAAVAVGPILVEQSVPDDN